MAFGGHEDWVIVEPQRSIWAKTSAKSENDP